MPDTMLRASLRSVTTALALVIAATACSDSATEPSALLVEAGHEAALDVLASLPTLPRMIDGVLGVAAADGDIGREDRVLLAAREMWLASGKAADPVASAAYRAAAIDLAAPALAQRLDSAAVARSLFELERWLAAADAVAGGADLVGIRAALDEGRAELKAARQAVSENEPAASIRALLRAADALDRTTPQSVATRLVRSAETKLAHLLADAPRKAAVDETLHRVDRLIRGAREALEEGDHARAIRRAYYADQLLNLR